MGQASENSLALHEILLSIADSLNVAQHQLRAMQPYDEYGRPNTLYQLPYLDFSLEVISEVASNTTSNSETENGNLNALRSAPAKNVLPIARNRMSLMRYNLPRPSQSRTENSSASSNNKITSTISGRFVAVMPNEGVPQVFIVLDSEVISSTEHKLIVKLTYATNEPVVGQKVEINFDEATSLSINESGTSITPPSFEPSKEGFTDGNGIYETEVNINQADVNKTIIFIANSGTIYTSLAISNT